MPDSESYTKDDSLSLPRVKVLLTSGQAWGFHPWKYIGLSSSGRRAARLPHQSPPPQVLLVALKPPDEHKTLATLVLPRSHHKTFRKIRYINPEVHLKMGIFKPHNTWLTLGNGPSFPPHLNTCVSMAVSVLPRVPSLLRNHILKPCLRPAVQA